MAALLSAVQGGHQGALMAPTEVLAEQHAASVRALLDGLVVAEPGRCSVSGPLQVALLTNRTRAAERRRILAGLADGTIDLAIGTHALIQDGVEFRSLGVAVVDEQHRFGVEQRAALRDANADGRVPDVLVMTATPIPRTAAMTVYGDLDVSVLDELPPGRTPDPHRWAHDAERRGRGLAAGPRAGGAGPPGLRRVPADRGVRQARGRLGRGDLRAAGRRRAAGLRLGLLHGRLPAEEKQAVMERFRSRRARRAGRHHGDRGRASTCPRRPSW